LTKAELNKIATEEGWFNSIDTIQKRTTLSKEKGADIKAAMFGLILAKVEEAKREIAKLEAAVQRVEAAARAGTIPKAAEGLNSKSADVIRIRSEMKALHGWTISLLESDISILMAVENPTLAGTSVRGIQTSFAELFALRVQDDFHMMKNFPDVFNRVIGI
jgi:CRISPR/Cas system CMR subunit Cmr6 (Cas7 group RAMP superfamily)